MEQIIKLRYELFVRTGIKTHFITNIQSEDMLMKYDAPTIDRLKGMTKTVHLSGESFRLKNQWSAINYPEILPAFTEVTDEDIDRMRGWKYKPSEAGVLNLRERLENITDKP